MTEPILSIDRTRTPTELAFSPDFNAASWFIDRHVEDGRGERIAIRQADAEVTYAELAGGVNRAGRALEVLGLEAGERVLLVVKDAPEFFTLFWGAIKTGLVPVPVSYLLRAADLGFMIADADARAVLYSPEFAAEVVPALAMSGMSAQGLRLDRQGGFLAEMDRAPGELDAVPAGPDKIAFWLYSSGTTEKPKGVLHRHRDIPFTCEHYAVGVLGLTEADACFSAAKLFFAYGLGNAMTFPLWVGGTAVLDERRPTPETTFETIEALGPTVYFGVPTLYAAQLQALESAGEGIGPDLSSLRLCVSAGEALPADLFRRWRAATGLEILDGIGSTEALHIFISNAPGAVRPGTTGRLVPGYDARIMDEAGQECGPGHGGELEIEGRSITPGYWNRPERTAAALDDGWLRTGDRYVRDEDGYFRYQGRADDMLKVGGIWCSPFDIEARLIEHPDVLEAAVVGREDENGLVKPEAWVVRADGGSAGGPERSEEGGADRRPVGADPVPEAEREALAEALVRHCQDGLPRYMYPRWIRFVPELPKTATGKIQRFKLRSM